MKLFPKITCAFLGVLLLFATSGCGEKYPEGMPKLVKVSLTFTQEGQPLQGATVSLFSEDPNFQWAVGGSTDNSGVAVLKTHGSYAGAPEGRFKICVRKYVREGELQTMANPGAPPPMDYNFVDAQYANKNDTPLSIEIKSGAKYEPFDLGPAVKELLKGPGM